MNARCALAFLALLVAASAGPSSDYTAAANVLPAPDKAFAQACAEAGSNLPAGVSLTAAEAIEPAPTWKSPVSLTSPAGETVGKAFCRLAGTIDGDIGFEIWLPRDWNGRILGAGVGGEAGYYNYADMARGVEEGFASASSDTGHKRGESWIDDPRRAENYSHIAYHRLTEVAKAAVDHFYGKPAAYSYFIGCSGGGRQGLREMQLYPGDYDGALIGAPGQDVPLLAARFLQVYLAQASGPASELSAADWDLIANSATTQCDRLDGLADGVIADPRACNFQVSELECQPGRIGNCLSAAKVRAAEAIIAPLRDRNDKTYDYGLLPGITARPGAMPPLPVQMFGGIVHHDPHWDPRSFDIARDLPAARKAFPTMDATSGDLSRFAARGGKLILYHGWADASVQPQATIDFYGRIRVAPGQRRDQFARLYMVPGMHHCRGGTGTDRFGASEDRTATADPHSDLLAALVSWVERNNPPGPIEARRLDSKGAVDRSRPICPFPEQATYRGAGSIDEAESFVCASTQSLNSKSRDGV